MLFGFGHLVSVMSAIHGKVDSATIEVRLKHLQRVPFPPTISSVGKGGRTYYSADDLMKIVMALELQAAGIVPAQVVGLVNAKWTTIARGLAAAWDDRGNPIGSIVLVAGPDPFGAGGEGAGRVDLMTDAEVGAWLKRRRPAGRKMAADGREQSDRRVTLIDLLPVAGALDAAPSPDPPALELVAMRRAIEDWAGGHRHVVRTGT